MDSVRKALQRIQSLYSRGVQSQNTRLSNRHIYNKLKTTRSRVVTQEKNKKQIISQFTYQTLGCVQLTEVPQNECPCTIPTGCMILRTMYPLPSLMTGMDKQLIQSVTGLEGRLILSETNYSNKKHNAGNRFTKNDPNYFIREYQGNNYLYITVNLRLQAISITALFDDPIEAYLYPSLCGNDGYDCQNYLDYPFPIDNDLMDGVIQLAATELIQLFGQQKQDLRNDSIDGTADTQGQDQGR